MHQGEQVNLGLVFCSSLQVQQRGRQIHDRELARVKRGYSLRMRQRVHETRSDLYS